MSGDSKKHLSLLFVGIAAFAVFFISADNSHAQEIDKDKALRIISEQKGPGGCDSEASCRDFCDNNLEVCLDWAKDNGVISNKSYEKHSNFTQEGGPGGCKTTDSCKSYCEEQAHFEECLSFGEKQGLISKEQAEQARKTGPGGCRTQKDCQAFCENPSNHDVCIEHAVQEGFMTREEAKRIKEFQSRANEFRKKAEEFRRQAEEFERPEVEEVDPGFDEDKARQILATQGGPGGCKTFDECEDFCENPDNQQACFEFAEKNNLFTNREHADKIKRIMQEGGPGGCRGERACHQFCENEANFDVCISFAEKEGLLPPQELERAKKGIQALREGGPSGCKNKGECERVCQDPTNQEACFEWAKKHGLISDEELRFMEEVREIQEEFESRRHEFESRPPEGFRPPKGFQSPGEFLSPGGCKGADECREYCSKPEHSKECGEGFKTPTGSQPPGFGGTPPSEADVGNIVCPQVYEPVCGSNERTYSNECEARREGIPIKYKRKCELSGYPEPTTTKQICPLMPEFECKEGQYKKVYYNLDGCPILECISAESYPTRPPEPYPYYSPTPQPTQDDRAGFCAEKGGSWTGTECKLPEIQPQPTSLREHSFLGAISRYLFSR